MSSRKRFYSYAGDTKAIAYIDIIGFGNLTTQFTGENAPAAEVFTFFENCILRYRESMKKGAPEFKREVPIAGDDSGHKSGFWYKEVPEGAINFIYQSDCAVLYSASLTHLFREVSSILGAAIIFGVPVRAAVTIGDLHHSEWVERPGCAICLYGAALTKAVKMESGLRGVGMRVVLDDDVAALMNKHHDLKWLVQAPFDRVAKHQLKWWLGAVTANRGRSESEVMESHFGRWFTDKPPKDWFEGPNCEDSKAVVARAVDELRNMGK